MRAKCSHKWVVLTRDGQGGTVTMTKYLLRQWRWPHIAKRCQDCGEQLSLGPAAKAVRR